jgi:hypothetical protein
MMFVPHFFCYPQGTQPLRGVRPLRALHLSYGELLVREGYVLVDNKTDLFWRGRS